MPPLDGGITSNHWSVQGIQNDVMTKPTQHNNNLANRKPLKCMFQRRWEVPAPCQDYTLSLPEYLAPDQHPRPAETEIHTDLRCDTYWIPWHIIVTKPTRIKNTSIICYPIQTGNLRRSFGRPTSDRSHPTNRGGQPNYPGWTVVPPTDGPATDRTFWCKGDVVKLCNKFLVHILLHYRIRDR